MKEQNNAELFNGFSDLYDEARPVFPDEIIKIINLYLSEPAEIVADLGSGTGLSTRVLAKDCRKVFGIEPNDDMRKKAETLPHENINYRKAYSDATGLEANSCDAVVCSQSFHWMNPKTTLDEISRILKPAGVFATVDYVWPPIMRYEVEMAYVQINKKIKHMAREIAKTKIDYLQYPKDDHLKNMKKSNVFVYCREISLCNTEIFTKERLYQLLLSMSSTQFLMKENPDAVAEDLDSFRKLIASCYPEDQFEIKMLYQIRIGVKHHLV